MVYFYTFVLLQKDRRVHYLVIGSVSTKLTEQLRKFFHVPFNLAWKALGEKKIGQWEHMR